MIDALEVEEGHFVLDELLACEEAFLASTTREVQAVSEIDGARLATVDGPRTRKAAAAVRSAVEADLASACSPRGVFRSKPPAASHEPPITSTRPTIVATVIVSESSVAP